MRINFIVKTISINNKTNQIIKHAKDNNLIASLRMVRRNILIINNERIRQFLKMVNVKIYSLIS